MKIFIVVGLLGLAPLSLAAPKKSGFKGLHTADRILLPLDSTQDANYLHQKSAKLQTIDAPLVSIEHAVDSDKKERPLKIKSLLEIAYPEKKPK